MRIVTTSCNPRSPLSPTVNSRSWRCCGCKFETVLFCSCTAQSTLSIRPSDIIDRKYQARENTFTSEALDPSASLSANSG